MEKCYIDSMYRDSALLSGYFYKVRNAQTDSLIRWLPYPPIQEEPRMSYSILTNDNTYIPTGIKQVSDLRAWLYPNPTREMSYLSVSTKKDERINVSVYSLDGRLVKTIYEGSSSLASNMPINTGNFNNGIYLIRISTSNDFKTLKLVVL